MATTTEEKTWDCECGTCGKEMNNECGGACDRREGREFYETCEACAEQGEPCVGAEGAPDCGGVRVKDGNVCDECFKFVLMKEDEEEEDADYQAFRTAYLATDDAEDAANDNNTPDLMERRVRRVWSHYNGNMETAIRGADQEEVDEGCEVDEHFCLRCGACWAEDERGVVVRGRECGHG